MQPHPLTNFEIQKYYQNEPKFNGVYSRCFMLIGKSLLDCTNLFSPNAYEKNDQIILKHFQ